MGWFGKKKIKKLDDKVWTTVQAKEIGFISDIKNEISSGKIILACYFFADTCQKIKESLLGSEIPLVEIEYGNVAGSLKPGIVYLVKSKALENSNFIAQISVSKFASLILFAEHHPLFSEEQNIISLCENLGPEHSYGFYTSLDDALFVLFDSQRIIDMMHKMGMNDTECISHSFISSAIENVQKKIEKQAHGNSPASNCKEWLRKNHTGI